MSSVSDEIGRVKTTRARLILGGGQKAIDEQHSRGKLTAWERVDRLCDPGTFREFNLWDKPLQTGFDIDGREIPRDAVVTGYGEVYGRPICVYSHDYTVAGGSQSAVQCSKVTKAMQNALRMQMPLVGMVDSGGARIQDRFGIFGTKSVTRGETISGIMYNPPQMSGAVPLISLMLGPCYAGSAYSPIMADFVAMRKKVSFMSVASPALLKTVTFADVTQEEIGGAELHATITGSCDFLGDSDEEILQWCRELLRFLPSSWREMSPHVDTGDDPNRVSESLLYITSEQKTYDMHKVIAEVVDNGNFFELQSLYARNMIIGFARLAGQTIGIIANNPAVLEGALDMNTSDKEARFIRFCDAFNIPIIFLVDTVGYFPSKEQELSGLARHAAKPIFAICESTVPKIVVYVGKVYGAARLAMGTERMGVDAIFAWPGCAIRPVINENRNIGIIEAASVQMVEDIIDPKETRPILVRTLRLLSKKMELPRPWRKHSLIPL